MHLIAEPTVLGFVQNEVPELSLIDRDDLGEISPGCLITFELLKESGEHGVVGGALHVLTAVVECLVHDTIEREHAAVVSALRYLGVPVGGDLLDVLDEGRLAVPGVTCENHEFGFVVEDAGDQIAVQFGFNIRLGVVASGATRTAFALTVESQKAVNVRIDRHFSSF